MREIAAADPVAHLLGPVARRFSHEDNAASLFDGGAENLRVVTGFGPTNAPTAGTLSVMLGVRELERHLGAPVTVVISDLGAWNSRNVAWQRLVEVRDRMTQFLRAIGFQGTVRSHLDAPNLVRAARIGRFLGTRDLYEHREELTELYGELGLLGSDIGMIVDTLLTVADILEPADSGAEAILMVSGIEESYFTDLARLVLARQASADALSLDWQLELGALYFRVLPGLGGYPKMSKSIPDSAIDLGMDAEALRERIASEDPDGQAGLLAAIELASGWPDERLAQAREAFSERDEAGAGWRAVKEEFLATFGAYAAIWRQA